MQLQQKIGLHIENLFAAQPTCLLFFGKTSAGKKCQGLSTWVLDAARDDLPSETLGPADNRHPICGGNQASSLFTQRKLTRCPVMLSLGCIWSVIDDLEEADQQTGLP